MVAWLPTAVGGLTRLEVGSDVFIKVGISPARPAPLCIRRKWGSSYLPASTKVTGNWWLSTIGTGMSPSMLTIRDSLSRPDNPSTRQPVLRCLATLEEAPGRIFTMRSGCGPGQQKIEQFGKWLISRDKPVTGYTMGYLRRNILYICTNFILTFNDFDLYITINDISISYAPASIIPRIFMDLPLMGELSG